MKIRLALVKAIGLGALFVAGMAVADEIVTPEDQQGWFEYSSSTGTFGLGITDQQGGTSSLMMSTNGTDGQIVQAARIPLIRIDAITSISWDAYSDQAAAGHYPFPQLEYWNPTISGTLVYVASNQTVANNTWTTITVDFNNDDFWDTRSGLTKSLANWQADPDVGPVLMNFFRMGYGSSSGTFAATTAYMDFVELNNTTWDFQDVAALPPQPPAESVNQSVPTLSQWALIVMVLSLGMVAFFRRKQFS